MSDINELIHAIGLAETLAAGVAREAEQFPTENITRIREALASAKMRAEEVAISADLICDADEAAKRFERARVVMEAPLAANCDLGILLDLAGERTIDANGVRIRAEVVDGRIGFKAVLGEKADV